MTKLASATIVYLALFAGAACLSYAQSINSGTVTDQTNAVVREAKVTLRNSVTGYDKSTVTDESGVYRFKNVPQNGYRLTVAEPTGHHRPGLQRSFRHGKQSSHRLCSRRQTGHSHLETDQPSTRWIRKFPSQENDDHNPARVKPRNIFNPGIGTDNLFHSEGNKRFTASLEVANLTNVVALYNFLSIFSGTHFLQPRTVVAHFGYTC